MEIAILFTTIFILFLVGIFAAQTNKVPVIFKKFLIALPWIILGAMWVSTCIGCASMKGDRIMVGVEDEMYNYGENPALNIRYYYTIK